MQINWSIQIATGQSCEQCLLEARDVLEIMARRTLQLLATAIVIKNVCEGQHSDNIVFVPVVKYSSVCIQPRVNSTFSASMEKYSEAKIDKGNVNSVYFHSSAEIFESVVWSLLPINKYAIRNVT